uniref:Uncharacterized protein n=1 Tax=Rhizophora mucronata TaxID=61149 RepID=A0A2P2QD68_RHIMU
MSTIVTETIEVHMRLINFNYWRC